MARERCQKGEGLIYTGKGSKELTGGCRVHVIVAIAYGKEVIPAKPYEKMTGKFFADFIKDNFYTCFAQAGQKDDGKRLFVMDNDPRQSSKVACECTRRY